jgi:hypothetical protein
VGVSVRSLIIEWLQVTVQTQFEDRPVAAPQMEALHQDRSEGRFSPLSGRFFGGWHEKG